MLDNDFAYRPALNNRYRPAFCLVDRHGRLRFVQVGETRVGDARAERIEADLRTLLAE
ncbi:MAG: hypothetical protein RLZ44_703 [Pseudomonadota bacterium]|jgi:hypothetical protein